jgi:propanediol utilization protein
MNRDREAFLAGRVAERVARMLARPWVPIEASGRHVHLSREDLTVLFGEGYQLTKKADLSQPGQFVCAERIRLEGPKGFFPNLVVLGPERGQTQVEISATDAVTLGIPAPVRLSGDIEDTPGALLTGPRGEIRLKQGVIVAQRHVHMTPGDAERYGLRDGQIIRVRVFGARALIFGNVALRVTSSSATFMHIDYDEGNACSFRKGLTGMIE